MPPATSGSPALAKKNIELAANSTIARVLGANDEYGSPESKAIIREIVLTELNRLKRYALQQIDGIENAQPPEGSSA